METYHMFYLAAISNKVCAEKIRTAACAIVLANRIKDQFLDNDSKHKIEVLAGRACVDALLQMPLKGA